MKKTMRIISIVLVLTMLFGSLPVNAEMNNDVLRKQIQVTLEGFMEVRTVEIDIKDRELILDYLENKRVNLPGNIELQTGEA
ncbi:MAG: hypothetical protein ACLKAK_09050 [Alkaliphilus sp.]